nr:hypothetical protein [Stutzerimonas zhaodongensis]
MLLNQSTGALATTLPSLLFLLPCLLMMVVCMKHMSSGKCDKAQGAQRWRKHLVKQERITH